VSSRQGRPTDTTPSAKGATKFNLNRILHPIEPATFMRDYWEKRPLIVKGRGAGYYAGLLLLRDVDQILNTSHLRPSTIRLVREGEGPGGDVLSGASTGRLEAVYEQYRAGFTVVLQFLQERWPPLRELCRSLATDLSSDIQVNVYLTPPHEKGLRPHYDSHDVFVLQTEGSKHWRIYEPPIRLPLRSQPYRSGSVDPGEPLHEFELEAGDLIYMPRGFMHDASATDRSSLHLTVGIHSVTWASVVLGAVQGAIEREASFRESLPASFVEDEDAQSAVTARLGELMDLLRREIVDSSIVRDTVDAARLGRTPVLDGHLLDLEAEQSVTLDTVVRRRQSVPWRLTSEGDRVCLAFHGKIVSMPDYVEADMRFITDTDEFAGADLPGDLDDAGRLCLVRRLLREGYLTLTPTRRGNDI
jgi:ribosomal protein L16 Arg81 hydroxylase